MCFKREETHPVLDIKETVCDTPSTKVSERNRPLRNKPNLATRNAVTGLTRRRFMQVAAASTATIPIDSATEATEVSADETPLFRFIQWNDLHVETFTPKDYELANKKARYLVESLNAADHCPVPDFVIAVGDMIHGAHGQESLVADLEEFIALSSDLTCPLYPVVGNHENIQGEGNPTKEGPYWNTFGRDRTNYTFDHGGLLFVIINNSGAPSSNQKEVGKIRNRWLAKVLADSKDKPKILCCHIPLVPIREESVLKESFGFSSYRAHDEEMLAMIDEYAESILAVLSGHIHLTAAIKRKGVYHIVPSGTASYPCDFASYEVFADRIRVRMHSLPEKWVTPSTDIHGHPRYKTDYTDTRHPTHESYMKGNPLERDFEIILPPAMHLSNG